MKTVFLIILSIGSIYLLYWAIFQQYSDKRFLFRTLSVLAVGFFSLVRFGGNISTENLFILLLAYLILSIAAIKLIDYLASGHLNTPQKNSQKLNAVIASALPLRFTTEREQLGPALALRLIMADDSGYGLEEETLESASRPNERDDRDGWHSEYNAFLGKYGADEEPFIYFYYPNASDFLGAYNIDKIAETFNGKKIRLLVEQIDPTQRSLIERANIKVRSFAEIIEGQGHLIAYRKWLQRNLNAPVAINVGPKIIDCAVPLSAEIRDIRDGAISEKIDDVIHYILNWVKRKDTDSQISILGEYGQGKSVLSLLISLKMMENVEEYGRIPILIELGGRSPRNIPPEELIASWAQRFSINPHIARYWIEEGKAVVIFDAFDEMDLIGDKNIVKEHFDALWRFAIGLGAKVIITGRPNLFLDEPEMAYALRLAGKPTSAFVSSSVPIYIKMLDRSKIKQILAAWPEEIATGLIEAFDHEPEGSEFRDLMSRPSMLMQAAAIWPQLSKAGINKDISGAGLMREFLYATFIRKRRTLATSPFKPKAPNNQLRLSLNELVFFMRSIALTMLKKSGSTNRIAKADYWAIVQRLIKYFPQKLAKPYLSESLDSELNKLPEHRTEPSLTRYVSASMKNSDQIEYAIAREVASTGILVEDELSKSSFKMAHKSFFEYIIAETYIMQRFPVFFDSYLEYTGMCKAIEDDCKTISIPFESVLHAANLIKLFDIERDLFLKVDIISRFVFRNHDALKSANKKTKEICSTTFFFSIFFGVSYGIISSYILDYQALLSKVILFASTAFFTCSAISLAVVISVSLILKRAQSLITWDNNTSRVIIAYNLLFHRSFRKLTGQMTFGSICDYLIGNCNVLAINGEVVKINQKPVETLDDFCRISSDRGFGAVDLLKPGTSINASYTVKGSSEDLKVPKGAGWRRASYCFDDFESFGPKLVFDRMNVFAKRFYLLFDARRKRKRRK